MVRITPFSLIFSMPVFITAVLLERTPFTLSFQALFLVLSVVLFTIDPKVLRWKRLLSLLPLLLFIILFNAFRGSGEILFRAGPLVFMRQGAWRGVFYAVFVLELWVMSGFLTGFEELELVSALHAIGRVWRRKEENRSGDASISFMILSVLRLFHSTYAELRRFFARGSGSLSKRTLLFIAASFQRAEEEYEQSAHIHPLPLRPRPADYLFVTVQTAFVVAAFMMKNPGGV